MQVNSQTIVINFFSPSFSTSSSEHLTKDYTFYFAEPPKASFVKNNFYLQRTISLCVVCEINIVVGL